MSLDRIRVRRCLQEFDFKKLFIEELGWNRHGSSLEVTIDGRALLLNAIAEKRGMVAFACPAAPGAKIPDYALRRKIERQVAKSVHENLIIFFDPQKTTQIWLWVKRELGKPSACREHTYLRTQPGDSLIQKLERIAYSLQEEESLTIPEVAGRARAAFDVDRVTKRFYERFQTEHNAFLQFLKGIPDGDLQRWYASVMLNRLMFIYFIQKQNFLDNDLNYLRNKLTLIGERGKDKYYREFLVPLFFEGFAKRETDRSEKTNRLLGKIPYLNGGLFLPHQIEQRHGKDILLGDSAFERLFAFFEQYQWHLDDRPLRDDREINPDVLGYIFEKYINQKEMGAYYTKEDITQYISKNTIIPYILHTAQHQCKIAFEGDQSVWKLLQSDPDRYIYEPLRKGVGLPLPGGIAAGQEDIAARISWNATAIEEYTLPNETWREVINRRRRYEELKQKILGGELKSVNDLISHNLNIRQFARDIIENSEGPELLRAFYRSIENISVLDPACGSGAFLFAALNILEDLYGACIDRMQAFVEELERSGKKHRPEKFSDFKKILAGVDQHPNRRYFIYKSIIVKNLYGVDVMEEATEICKLRLFLKLVSQIDQVNQIEPLPDIDFNIRAGNSLVGFGTYDEIKRVMESKLDFDDAMQKIEQKAQDVDRLFSLFRQQQTELGGEVTAEDKEELQRRLRVLDNELNSYLAKEYGIDPRSKTSYAKWLDSHKPFHWFIEFHRIMSSGGFDAVIGNPPYVEYHKVRNSYVVQHMASLPCNNLYAFMVERATKLWKSESGLIGLILPLSLVCTEKMKPLRALLQKEMWIACFDMRPASLFEGVAQRLAIVLMSGDDTTKEIHTGGYRRWTSTERLSLIETTHYIEQQRPLVVGGVIPKLSSDLEERLLDRFGGRALGAFVDPSSPPAYVHRIVRYFVKALDFIPVFMDASGKRGKSEDYKEFHFLLKEADCIVALLNSSLFYWFWRTHADGFHCGYQDVFRMPYKEVTDLTQKNRLTSLKVKLIKFLRDSSELKSIETKSGAIRYQEFYPKMAKPIIDKIDEILAEHFGLDAEELDFLINYDIKYRVGQAEEESENQEVAEA